MSSILVTFPGKFGDLLWALPTIREISSQAGEPVDLAIGGKYSGILELLRLQPYIHQAFGVKGWEEGEHASWEPPSIGNLYEKVWNLRYPGWPTEPLPIYTFRSSGMPGGFSMAPWIALPPIHQPAYDGVYFGWSDEHFELKLGLTLLVSKAISRQLGDREFIMAPQLGSRWVTEAHWLDGDPYEWPVEVAPAGWLEAAKILASCRLYVGCLSAQWVLANALGIPCCVVEPSEARHNPIFWWDGPIEKDGKPRNRMVRGNDGKPTFDARHVIDAIKEELGRER